jgi:hypothetical protein
MTWCTICGEDDHRQDDCELRLGNRQVPDQAGLLPQHRRCPRCQAVTHAWDRMPCGHHSVPGAAMPRADPPSVTPPRRPVRDLCALALQQAAESRAQRAVLEGLHQPQQPAHHPGRDHGGEERPAQHS